jgi:uncharacterized protein (TIGR00369 family)
MGKTFIMRMLNGEIPLPEIARSLGAKVIKALPDQGLLSMEYAVGLRFTNPAGTIQGGILASMLDDAMSLALLATCDENVSAPSLELKINFILPAFPGKFTGMGRVLSKGKSVCVLEGDLWQNKKHIARASATALINRKRTEQSDRRFRGN